MEKPVTIKYALFEKAPVKSPWFNHPEHGRHHESTLHPGHIQAWEEYRESIDQNLGVAFVSFCDTAAQVAAKVRENPLKTYFVLSGEMKPIQAPIHVLMGGVNLDSYAAEFDVPPTPLS